MTPSQALHVNPVPAMPPATDASSGTPAPSPVRPGATMTWLRGSALRYVLRLGSVALGIFVWHLLSTRGAHFVLDFRNVPGPVAVWHVFVGLLAKQVFYVDIGYSLKRIAIAYLLATVLGIAIGVVMGRFRLAQDLVTPHIEILRPIPAVAWIPLAILMLPTEESSIVFITFLGAFFPIVLNTVNGVGQTPKTLVQAARSLGAGNAAILSHVVLPSALPAITAGLAVGMGVAWFSLLAGEMISGQYGIGYFTWNAYTLVEYPQIIVGMLCIGGLGTLSTHLVRLATKPLLRWQGDKVGAMT